MKRTLTIDPANTCTHCPHAIVNIGRSMWCPCEDCHPGGLVQGREPFDVGRTTVAQVAATEVPVFAGSFDSFIRGDDDDE